MEAFTKRYLTTGGLWIEENKMEPLREIPAVSDDKKLNAEIF